MDNASLTDPNDPAVRRYANLDLDDAQVATPVSTPVVSAALPQTPSAPVVRGVTIDQEAASRITADAKAATDATGLALPPPLFAVGTTLLQVGVDNAQAQRSEFEDLPFADDACKAFADQIAAEKREDHLVDAVTLSMAPDGSLSTPWNGNLYMTEVALDGLCGFVTPGGAGYLTQCEPDLRATNMNRWLPKANRVDKRAYNRAVKGWEKEQKESSRFAVPFTKPEPQAKNYETPRKVTLRAREMNGKREIFSVVGPRYGVFDADKIALEIAKGCPPQTRCEIRYDGFRTTVNALAFSNVAPDQMGVGELFKTGIKATTADDGTGAIKFSVQLWRAICKNFMTVDVSKLVGSRRHIGQSGNIAADVQEMMQLAMSKVGFLMNKWSEGSAEDILSRYSLDNPEQVFQGLVANRVVHVPGVRPEEMVQRLMKAWNKEPGRYKTAFLNAITRCAHEESWDSPWITDDLESAAGEMLMATVWRCTPPVEENLFA